MMAQAAVCWGGEFGHLAVQLSVFFSEVPALWPAS
jgi:hypothetical protein